MTSNLYETIQRIVREELGQLRTAELAVVQEQHPHSSESDKDNYACTVVLRDSGLVLEQVPVATPRTGHVSVPDVGNLVLVQFVGGDVNAPVIIGSLYNDEERPPLNELGQVVWHLPLDAGESEALHLSLQSGEKRELDLLLGNGLALHLRDDDPVVELTVDGGKATLQIDRDGAVTVTTQGNIKIESQGNVEITGNEINVKAQAQLNLKGATVNIN
ncbi:MAG: phage baseplate assembly protein V [Ardenticatenaceae bacterium]